MCAHLRLRRQKVIQPCLRQSYIFLCRDVPDEIVVVLPFAVISLNLRIVHKESEDGLEE